MGGARKLQLSTSKLQGNFNLQTSKSSWAAGSAAFESDRFRVV
jgi:hypothetical protein